MRVGIARVVLAAVTVAGGVDVNAQTALSAVRPESVDLRALIDSGVERSATFRDLITRLNDTDVVIYVRFSPCPSAVPACLLWASSTPPLRRLLIKVDRFGGSENSIIAMVAHELQHACEVASTPGITDLASFQTAFAALGWHGSHGFETKQAQEVARRVLMELARAQPNVPVK